jgi:hypothetical protein
MALSYAPRETSAGGQRVVGDLTFDASYATGGLPVDFTKIQASAYSKGPLFVSCEPVPTGAHQGKTIAYDRVNAKLIALSAAGAEVANATDLSAMTIRVFVEMALA